MNRSLGMKERVSSKYESLFAKAVWALQPQLLEVMASLTE